MVSIGIFQAVVNSTWSGGGEGVRRRDGRESHPGGGLATSGHLQTWLVAGFLHQAGTWRPGGKEGMGPHAGQRLKRVQEAPQMLGSPWAPRQLGVAFMKRGVWSGWAGAFLFYLLSQLFPSTICSSISPTTLVDYCKPVSVPGTEDSDMSPTGAPPQKAPTPRGNNRTVLVGPRNDVGSWVLRHGCPAGVCQAH